MIYSPCLNILRMHTQHNGMHVYTYVYVLLPVSRRSGMVVMISPSLLLPSVKIHWYTPALVSWKLAIQRVLDTSPLADKPVEMVMFPPFATVTPFLIYTTTDGVKIIVLSF